MKKNRMKKMMNLYFLINMSGTNVCFTLILNYSVKTEENFNSAFKSERGDKYRIRIHKYNHFSHISF